MVCGWLGYDGFCCFVYCFGGFVAWAGCYCLVAGLLVWFSWFDYGLLGACGWAVDLALFGCLFRLLLMFRGGFVLIVLDC